MFLFIIRSGWGKFYNSDPPTFLGGANATEETLSFPGFGTTGIDWQVFFCHLFMFIKKNAFQFHFGSRLGVYDAFSRLVRNSDFVGIGVDSLSIELGRTQVRFCTKENGGFL